MIIDTDVLIFELRGNKNAKQTITRHIPFTISVVTYMVLVQGMQNKHELQAFLRQIHRWSVKIIHLDTAISMHAMYYIEEFHLSHSMEIADALIAATASEENDTLLTANCKHYRHIPNIQLKMFAP